MNLKLPLKTESVDAWNGVYLFDNNDIQIGRIYNRETAEELVSSVNSCPAMRETLKRARGWFFSIKNGLDKGQTKFYSDCMINEIDELLSLSFAPVDQGKEDIVKRLEDADLRIRQTSKMLLDSEQEAAGWKAKLDKAVELLEACEPFIKQFAPQVLAPELEATLKELEGK
jgi:hypothetical protein